MADVWHHAVSSARKFGGRADDYVPIHAWFDETKRLLADFRHRALRHHAEGIAQAVERFGPVVRNSSGRAIPVRWIGEQHVREDFGGRIPTAVDWLTCLQPQRWMAADAVKLSETMKKDTMTEETDG